MTFPKIDLDQLPAADTMVAGYSADFPCDISNCNATDAWVVLMTYVYN